MKILLLQVRNPNDTAREDERVSFARKAGISIDQIISYDLLKGPPSLQTIRRHDALMVGGSGDYYVSKENVPHLSNLLDVLVEVIEIAHPTFASCFGFQLLIKALGGSIIHDPPTMEVGTYELTLTDTGRGDELLGSLPVRFQAQLGHKDRAEHLPGGVLNLALSNRCAYQAIRIPGKPIWATQFHPELNGEENRKRFLQYLEGYSAHLTAEEREEKLSHFGESPETVKLIPRFLDLVFG